MKRWFGFIALLLVNLSVICSHTTINMFKCDRDILRYDDKLIDIYGKSFANKESDPCVLNFSDKLFVLIHFKDGYSSMIIDKKDESVKFEVIFSTGKYNIYCLIRNMDQYLQPSFFTVATVE